MGRGHRCRGAPPSGAGVLDNGVVAARLGEIFERVGFDNFSVRVKCESVARVQGCMRAVFEDPLPGHPKLEAASLKFGEWLTDEDRRKLTAARYRDALAWHSISRRTMRVIHDVRPHDV